MQDKIPVFFHPLFIDLNPLIFMKTMILAFVCWAYTFSPLQAQTAVTENDSTSYQYAFLVVSEYGIRGRASVNVSYDDESIVGLTEMIEEKVKQKPDRKARFDLLMTLEAIKYLDRRGYELAGTSSTLSQNAWTTREYAFRKKRVVQP